MNHDRLFHKGTGTVQSKKLYFVLSIVIVLGVTICFSGEFGILLIDW